MLARQAAPPAVIPPANARHARSLC